MIVYVKHDNSNTAIEIDQYGRERAQRRRRWWWRWRWYERCAAAAAPSQSSPPPPPPPPQVWNVPTDPIGPGLCSAAAVPLYFVLRLNFFFFFIPLPILFSPLRRPISHTHTHTRSSARTVFARAAADHVFPPPPPNRVVVARRALAIQSYAVAARVYSCAALVVAVSVCIRISADTSRARPHLETGTITIQLRRTVTTV